ncbi:MAG TPA: HD domain-containing protein [Candidatus Syntrophosphaera thermopropionivorans]|jgi:dGTPase|uniref:HD domain-containing protein n=1 Tax=Candidatus Syntrophosphaera thermopropionivorans TaxID=2593015 RepID=A0AC61QJ37_9BACT|nr:HD domain-containing protein [Candidatus Syntrophosphaera thermopropionivorans]HRQ99453.1 HD domain-containing protein [Candidatus Syntrophosphaera sp.]TDF72948.1 HD domain-containing protein [Candidatus Syntrophosphaera thermopropionivorans]HON33002.1 HD domain-containing protein [Candidatus Syntrophosphaera thermopropionivorans]HPX63658.1 HD domain-containing protein [Candidatus Syntrophosphaera thermopropionivorans]HQC58646.1 HD domain-containing protein [Candidatus Syntrophosphaera ther
MDDKLYKIFEEVKRKSECTLGPRAYRDADAKRMRPEEPDDMRTQFAVDRDRILYSGAYRRYHGKTQVFSFTNLIDEEMTNRNLHIAYVSQISRTIGKYLGLNTELIEAIALGHDLGHPPFGHDGEIALSDACVRHGIGHFHHNIESLHIVDHISRKGRGLNLTFPVRDGIISHDGEVHNTILYPEKDKNEARIQEYIRLKKEGMELDWMPATLEGCVVRITDTIAYIGQDIEDAIRFNLLKREDLPQKVTDKLGNTNSQIIDTLIRSVIINSYGQDWIAFDEETSYYLLELKKFNYENIYTNEKVKKSNKIIYRTMGIMFDKYLEDIEKNNRESKIFKHFLDHKSPEYREGFSPAEQVRDFIATMTDRYYNEEIKDYLLPWKW